MIVLNTVRFEDVPDMINSPGYGDNGGVNFE